MAGGYKGKYCIVNLSDATTEVVTPDEAFYQKYLSGYGLGAAVIMERQKPGLDPLAPRRPVALQRQRRVPARRR